MNPLAISFGVAALVWFLTRRKSATETGARITPGTPGSTLTLPAINPRPINYYSGGNAGNVNPALQSLTGPVAPDAAVGKSRNWLAQRPLCKPPAPATNRAPGTCGCAGSGTPSRCKPKPRNQFTDGAGACLAVNTSDQLREAGKCGSKAGSVIQTQTNATMAALALNPSYQALFGNALASGKSDSDARTEAACVLAQRATDAATQQAIAFRNRPDTRPSVSYNPPVVPTADSRVALNYDEYNAMQQMAYGSEGAKITGDEHNPYWNLQYAGSDAPEYVGNAFSHALEYMKQFYLDPNATVGNLAAVTTGAYTPGASMPSDRLIVGA